MTTPIIFTRTGVQNFKLGIPAAHPKATAKQKAEVEHLRKVARGNGFDFRYVAGSPMSNPKCSCVVEDQKAIAFITKVAKENPRLGIKTDLSLMPLGCPYCDFKTGGNTSADQDALAQHILEKHSGDDEEDAAE